MDRFENYQIVTKKAKKSFLVAVAIGLLLEFFCSSVIKVVGPFTVSRAIITIGIVWFVILHFYLGIKNLYTFIIDRRIFISLIMIVLTTILEMLQNNTAFLDVILYKTIPYGLTWNIRFYMLLLVTFEFFMIMTDRQKYLSFIFTIIVAFSGNMQYMFNYINAVIIGEMGIIFLHNYIRALLSNKPNKTEDKVWLILMIISGILYGFTYDSFLIAFGYIFLALTFWLLIKNWKELKSQNKLINVILPIVGITIYMVVLKMFILTGSRNIIEDIPVYDRGIFGVFDYLYTFFIPFVDIQGGPLLASYLSIFPIPLLITLYCLYKEEKHVEFLLPMAVVSTIEVILYMMRGEGVFEVINKVTLFSKVNSNILLHAINYTNLLMMFYFAANYQCKFFSFKHTIRITIVASAVMFLVLNRPEELSSNLYLYFFSAEFCLLTFTFLNIDDEKYKKVFLSALLIFTVVSGAFVHPVINRGLDTVSQIPEATENDVTYDSYEIMGEPEPTK